MKLGKTQTLTLIQKGKYLWASDGTDEVPIHGTETGEDGDKRPVFLYRENNGQIAGMLEEPLIEVGEVAKLKVVDKSKIGYFVDINAPKDILLPFSEATERIHEGERYLFTMYVDKSNRLAVSMEIKDVLSSASPYKRGDTVKGTVYHAGKSGILVAVDDKYDGMIPKQEMKGIYHAGDEIEARVANVLDDGKLTLSLRAYAHVQMLQDSDVLYDLMDEYKGVLPVGDKSSPEEIMDVTGLTKKAFKRAVGKLYKEGKAVPGKTETRRK
ncbi:MAG: S1-like domain-containing RNA-binding protein [Peptoniphilus sp.]|nr:S1-like domain-containing RNA-binding protein [Peptoniphilus sp.]MDD7363624.1 S1-like domain-containing RNA-binding protein [Bacillota bacterium]MDY6044731.1 S1-like domain-containing RNA-binding protein [Peptoniphilus sp.]